MKLAFGAVLAATLTAAGFYFWAFVEQDRCLDGGGQWTADQQVCAGRTLPATE